MLSATLFIIIIATGYVMALLRGPLWGAMVYVFVYFMPPYEAFNWWAVYVPDLKWGLLTPGIWLLSMLLHRDRMSEHKPGIIYLGFFFCIYTVLISYTNAVDPDSARYYSYMLFCYCIIMSLFLKSVKDEADLRLLIIAILLASFSIVMTSYGEGTYLDGRLNNVGPSDAKGSNELGILLGSVMPLALPYIFKGKRHEKVICIILIPLLINIFTLTVSRSAFVALLGSMAYAFMILSDKKLKKYILIACLCAVPLFAFLADDGYEERISTIWHMVATSEEDLNRVSSGRTNIWKYGFEMLKDYPRGVGPEGFRQLSRFYMLEDELTYDPARGYGVRDAHSSYIKVLVEQGVVGFCIFIIICLVTVYRLYRSAIMLKTQGRSGTFLGLLIISLNISVVCTLIGGLFNSRVYYEYFWWQVSFAILAYTIVRQTCETEKKEEAVPVDA